MTDLKTSRNTSEFSNFYKTLHPKRIIMRSKISRASARGETPCQALRLDFQGSKRNKLQLKRKIFEWKGVIEPRLRDCDKLGWVFFTTIVLCEQQETRAEFFFRLKYQLSFGIHNASSENHLFFQSHSTRSPESFSTNWKMNFFRSKKRLSNYQTSMKKKVSKDIQKLGLVTGATIIITSISPRANRFER